MRTWVLRGPGLIFQFYFGKTEEIHKLPGPTADQHGPSKGLCFLRTHECMFDLNVREHQGCVRSRKEWGTFTHVCLCPLALSWCVLPLTWTMTRPHHQHMAEHTRTELSTKIKAYNMHLAPINNRRSSHCRLRPAGPLPGHICPSQVGASVMELCWWPGSAGPLGSETSGPWPRPHSQGGDPPGPGQSLLPPSHSLLLRRYGLHLMHMLLLAASFFIWLFITLLWLTSYPMLTLFICISCPPNQISSSFRTKILSYSFSSPCKQTHTRAQLNIYSMWWANLCETNRVTDTLTFT